MSQILNLKLTKLTSTIVKCGFPVKSSEKYFNILKKLDYDFEIISFGERSSKLDINTYIRNQKLNDIINTFLKINIDELSIPQAFELLSDLKTKFSQIQEIQEQIENF